MKDNKKTTQTAMDKTLEDSFPASDPPSWSSPQPEKHPQKQLKAKQDESKGRPEHNHQDHSRKDFLHEYDPSRTGTRH